MNAESPVAGDEYQVMTSEVPLSPQHWLLSTVFKESEMSNQMGKRYICAKCGVEVIITKAGSGTIVCCGQDMAMKK